MTPSRPLVGEGAARGRCVMLKEINLPIGNITKFPLNSTANLGNRSGASTVFKIRMALRLSSNHAGVETASVIYT